MAKTDAATFHDRDRAESFGANALAYDAYPPSYPAALISWLSGSCPGSAIDVGTGTGQVARLVIDAGWQVTGVEPDDRMAAVARNHGVDVVVAKFADWVHGHTVDLVCAGQAWHWINPATGYQRAAQALRCGGRLAIFWNSYRYDEATNHALHKSFGRHAPHLLVDSVPLGTVKPNHAALDADTIRRSAHWFSEPEIHVFEHNRRQTVETWLAEACTHSLIAQLDESVRTALFSELGNALTDLNQGIVEVLHETRCTTALRQ